VVVRRFAEVVPAGMEVVVLAQAPEPARHRKGDLPIVYEDEDLLVVDKPAGLLTATVPGEKRPTLWAKVEAYLERTSPRSRVGLIHRLDKDARGLLVFSKHGAAFASLKAQLKDRVMEREYHAVVLGRVKPASGTVESLLVENEVEGTVSSTTNPRRGEPAVTHYETLRAFNGSPGRPAASMVKVRLETGRKHQIRVHMAEKGAPILGDILYGKSPNNRPPLMLAATRLGVIHPGTGKKVVWELPVPGEFWAAVGKVG
jgi:23S rRNA pseudouridine1911/1915/1917 synthase